MAYASTLETRIAKKVTRAISDYGLIEDGDRVMVGLSGGKDSWALIGILDELRKRHDALLIATVDTEVGVWALDGGHLQGDPRLTDGAVADDGGPIVAAFDDPDAVSRSTRRLVLYALTAPDVPDVAVTEALYTAWEVIDAA